MISYFTRGLTTLALVLSGLMTGCALAPAYPAPAVGEPVAEVTYVRVGNSVAGYLDQNLRVSHGGCSDFMELAAFPQGDKDPARSQPRSLAVRAGGSCFWLHLAEYYPLHGTADCNSIFEVDLIPGRRYTLQHIYEARSGPSLSIEYRCRPIVTDTLTGQPVAFRLVEKD